MSRASIILLASLLISFGPSVLALSEADRQLIIDLHNELRQTLVNGTAKNRDGSAMPTASNMKQMRYNRTIEEFTQQWVNLCQFQHSQGPFGENLWMTSNPNIADAEAARGSARSWWVELTEIGFSNSPGMVLTRAHMDAGLGHWTQMAWADSDQLGCAVAHCPSSTIFMCNYNPPGNFMNSPIYRTGTACSACATGYTCNNANGLCMLGNGDSATSTTTTSTRAPTTTRPSTSPSTPTRRATTVMVTSSSRANTATNSTRSSTDPDTPTRERTTPTTRTSGITTPSTPTRASTTPTTRTSGITTPTIPRRASTSPTTRTRGITTPSTPRRPSTTPTSSIRLVTSTPTTVPTTPTSTTIIPSTPPRSSNIRVIPASASSTPLSSISSSKPTSKRARKPVHKITTTTTTPCYDDESNSGSDEKKDKYGRRNGYY